MVSFSRHSRVVQNGNYKIQSIVHYIKWFSFYTVFFNLRMLIILWFHSQVAILEFFKVEILWHLKHGIQHKMIIILWCYFQVIEW